MEKMCVLCVVLIKKLLLLNEIPKWLKCHILFVFFPQVVQKQTVGEVGN